MGKTFLLLLLTLRSAFAADSVLSGTLEGVLDGSIFIRLADGRLIDARLPRSADLSAGTIADHYNLADQVEITCKPIQAVYNKAVALHQHLELEKLKRIRAASAEELNQALRHRQGGANLLIESNAALKSAPPAAPEGLLEHMRQVNLDFGANLPNFVVDEVVKRYTAPFGSKDWRPLDTIETEVAFRGGKASRENIRRNSQPWKRPFTGLPGTLWGVFFGTQLRPLLSPDCPTSIEFEGREAAQERPLLAFRFTSPPDACFRPFYSKGRTVQYNAARAGRFLVDDPGGNMIRYEEEATFPQDAGLDRWTVVEFWDYVRIGDDSHLLPVGVEITGRGADGFWSRESVTYKNHRHFEASTNLVFH